MDQKHIAITLSAGMSEWDILSLTILRNNQKRYGSIFQVEKKSRAIQKSLRSNLPDSF